MGDGIGDLRYLSWSREQFKVGTQSLPVWSCKCYMKPANPASISRPKTKAWQTFIFSRNKCCSLGNMALFFFYHIAISTVPPAAFKLRLGNHYSSALRQSPISNYIPCCRCTASIPAVFLLCASFFTRPFATPYSLWEAKLSTQPFYLSDNLDDQEPSQALFLKSV